MNMKKKVYNAKIEELKFIHKDIETKKDLIKEVKLQLENEINSIVEKLGYSNPEIAKSRVAISLIGILESELKDTDIHPKTSSLTKEEREEYIEWMKKASNRNFE